jgi:hypothetical protein
MLAAWILATFSASSAVDALTSWVTALLAIILALYHGVVRHRMNWSCRAKVTSWVLALVATPSFHLTCPLQPLFDSDRCKLRDTHFRPAGDTFVLFGGGFVFFATLIAQNEASRTLHIKYKIVGVTVRKIFLFEVVLWQLSPSTEITIAYNHFCIASARGYSSTGLAYDRVSVQTFPSLLLFYRKFLMRFHVSTLFEAHMHQGGLVAKLTSAREAHSILAFADHCAPQLVCLNVHRER